MKKDAIIDLLENDLREIETLVETFREPERIGSAFLDLLRQKHESLGKEIRLLDYWATDNMSQAGSATLSGEVRAERAEAKATQPAEPQKSAEEGSKIVPQAAPAAPKTREKIEDYFAAELEAMDDPFATAAQLSPAQEQTKQAPAEQTKQIAQQPATEAEQEAIETAPAAEAQSQRNEKQEEAEKPATPEINTETPAPHPTPTQRTTPAAKQPAASPAPKPAVVVKTNEGSKGADIAAYGTPVDDLNKAMGINDRFLYMRELFGGNKMAFDAAVETVNAATTYKQAYEYLRQTFGWDESDATVEAFLKAVHRRFI